LKPGQAKVSENCPDLTSISFSAKAGWCGMLFYPGLKPGVKQNDKQNQLKKNFTKNSYFTSGLTKYNIEFLVLPPASAGGNKAQTNPGALAQKTAKVEAWPGKSFRKLP
jgi:hypothetical protein